MRIIKDFFSKGHERSIEAKKNILGSILIKGCSIAIGLISVPLTIGYVNPSHYGIWLTLSSMIAWVSFFDIGFTHGLRNKFAEANAKGDEALAKTYVSTAYYFIAIIFGLLGLLLVAVNQFISWHALLNLPATMEVEVSRLATIIFICFSLHFIFRLITTLLIASQVPAKASLVEMLGQLLTLIIIYILTKTTKEGSLLHLGLAAGFAPVVVLLAANFWFFNTRLKKFKPSLLFVKKEYAKDIMKLGLKFFVLQIAVIVQFESSMFLIARYFNTTEVTSYNIAYRYFFTLQMFFLILLSPFWSGVTYAYNTKDYEWIKNAVKKYLLLLVPIICGGVLMLVFSDTVYRLWLGKNLVHIDFTISLLCLVFFSTAIFANIFVYVLNGIGAIQLQFISAIFTSVGFVALSLALIKYTHMGVKSVLIASIISNAFGYIFAPVQYYKIFYQKSAAAIWYK